LDLHPLSVAPFVILLLLIALLPLVAEQFWHSNHNRFLVSVGLALPVVIYLIWHGPEATHHLIEEMKEYVAFVVLLGSLYVISGGLLVLGTLRATPPRNTLLLAGGALLANLIGTTGASMVLIRPYLRMNQGRPSATHLVVFFIFLVSNLGGALTPLGDPPLFLGFLRGVDFWWTLRLWPHWAFVMLLVLGIFLIWDTLLFRRETPRLPSTDPEVRLGLRGKINILLLIGVVLAVLVQSPGVARHLKLDGLGREGLKWLGCAAMVTLALLSLILTPRAVRGNNGFTWGPIIEVAVVFLGLFATMGPALVLLEHSSQRLGLTQPWHYFWLTGILSSFLDNAPTYLAFGTLASSTCELTGLDQLSLQQEAILIAISCGAVFMGANTYIGNGPNFMVKAIAEESGMPAPSFFGYMAYSAVILLPVFVLLTLLFFRPT
jgi:Na+/H+ antiporter NhaD/arsenite permease-like protein